MVPPGKAGWPACSRSSALRSMNSSSGSSVRPVRRRTRPARPPPGRRWRAAGPTGPPPWCWRRRRVRATTPAPAHGLLAFRSRERAGLDELGCDLRIGGALAERRAQARQRACAAGRPAEWQIRRPCQIIRCERSVQSRRGMSAATSASTFTGSTLVVQPNRRASRPKWVSTVMPGMPKALPSTTLAVFRPTPGRVTRSFSRPAPRRRTGRTAPARARSGCSSWRGRSPSRR